MTSLRLPTQPPNFPLNPVAPLNIVELIVLTQTISHSPSAPYRVRQQRQRQGDTKVGSHVTQNAEFCTPHTRVISALPNSSSSFQTPVKKSHQPEKQTSSQTRTLPTRVLPVPYAIETV